MPRPPKRNPTKPPPGYPPLAEVKPLPVTSVRDVAGGLRRLADRIENGDFGSCHNVLWVLDKGNAKIEFGLLGEGDAGLTALLLMRLAEHDFMQRIKDAG